MKRSPLWVITSFYNPAGYSNRIRNFQAFRRHLKFPLLAVELAKRQAHQLKPDDADIVISLTGDDQIWQKERLLNIAIGALPKEVKYVAWIDCDVLFGNPNWGGEAVELLEKGSRLVQLFEYAVHLPREITPELVNIEACHFAKPLLREISLICAVSSGSFTINTERLSRFDAEENGDNGGPTLISNGMAWAGRRDRLQEVGLYDACVVGGGDTATAYAGIGVAEKLVSENRMTEMHTEHYKQWAADFERIVGRRVGCVSGTVYHLWHGRFNCRGYSTRHTRLKELGFDPFAHLELSENDTWRWMPEAWSVRSMVRDYFFQRAEDSP